MPPKMVQVFMVLRCCSCESFQVHQVKKTNKWSCKVCGTKQSVIKVYGKGSAPDCRKHVQKLNTLRGEVEAERNQHAVSGSHPPEDYPSAFDATSPRLRPEEEEEEGEELSHPVLIAERESKWTTYTDPQDSDEESGGEGQGSCTTDRNEFVQANKRLRRSVPDVRALSKSCWASRETVSPYSSTSREMMAMLDNQAASQMKTSQSCFTLSTDKSPSRYTKLDEPLMDRDLSCSVGIGAAPPGRLQHQRLKAQLKRIREDIGQYSREEVGGAREEEIPKAASKWNQFMCESESEEEEEGEGGGYASAHVLNSRSSVARYTLSRADSSGH